MLETWRILWKLCVKIYKIRSCFSSPTASCWKALGSNRRAHTQMLIRLPKIVQLVRWTLKKEMLSFSHLTLRIITRLNGITMKSSFQNVLMRQVRCTRHQVARKDIPWHSFLLALGIANAWATILQDPLFQMCSPKSFTFLTLLLSMPSSGRTRMCTLWPPP